MKTNSRHTVALFTFTLLLLSGCQTTSISQNTSNALRTTPNTINVDTKLGEQYSWGGKILSINTLQDHTELTILSYPLSQGYPKIRGSSTGRFIAQYTGYLEPLDYAPGRLVTVNGNLAELREGTVAEAQYQFPVLASEDLKLLKPKKKIPFSVGFSFGF